MSSFLSCLEAGSSVFPRKLGNICSVPEAMRVQKVCLKVESSVGSLGNLLKVNAFRVSFYMSRLSEMQAVSKSRHLLQKFWSKSSPVPKTCPAQYPSSSPLPVESRERSEHFEHSHASLEISQALPGSSSVEGPHYCPRHACSAGMPHPSGLLFEPQFLCFDSLVVK